VSQSVTRVAFTISVPVRSHVEAGPVAEGIRGGHQASVAGAEPIPRTSEKPTAIQEPL